MNHKINLIIVAWAAALSFYGCTKDDSNSTVPDSPGANEVWMRDMAFSPATRTVPVNTTVTWTNKDAAPHNVVSNDSAFASGNMSKDAVFSHRFTSAGTYTYRCTLHAGMTGTVIVQ